MATQRAVPRAPQMSQGSQGPRLPAKPTLPQRLRRITALLAAIILISGGALAGCSNDDSPAPIPTPTEVRTSPPTVTQTDAELNEIILDQYWKFWEALKTAELGNPDIELFDGLAHGQILNEILGTAQQRKDDDAPRLGEPVWKSDLEVFIHEDQSSVDVVACVDRGPWVPEGFASDIEDVVQYTVSFFPIYNEWVVTWIEADLQACQDV